LYYHLSRELQVRFKGLAAWQHAAHLAIAQIPSFQSAQQVAKTWRTVSTASPKDADRTAERLQQDVTDCCLKWLDDRTDDRAAPSTLLQAAASYLQYGAPGRVAVQRSKRLFLGCLGRAAKRGVPSDVVRRAVDAFLKGLARSKVGEDVVKDLTSEIEHHYPELVPPAK
jgi:hypothetical protein